MQELLDFLLHLFLPAPEEQSHVSRTVFIVLVGLCVCYLMILLAEYFFLIKQ